MSCKYINLDNKTSAIICGHKDHECDDKQVVYTDDEGNEYWNPIDFMKLQEEHNIVSGSVVYSICGRPAIMDAPYL